MIDQRTGGWVSAFVTTVLSTAAAVAVISGIWMALGRTDTEPLESPLLLAVSHQLTHGPWELYGPFNGQNPLVIIHAPLYYRLAALVAWPLVRAGLDPVTAALAAGRSLSFLGLAWTMAAAYRIARLDGAPRAAGGWAMLLIAASLVVGAMPYAVRPDMLGIALQTTGVLLVLSVLRADKPGRGTLPAAYAAFGLAICVKQHFIVGPLVSAFLLLAACVRGRLSSRLVVPGFLTGLAIVLIVYGTEELASEGRMSQAIFQAAASSNQVHPVDWMRAAIVVFGIVGKSAGLIVVFLAVGLADVGSLPGIGRRALVLVGTALVSVFAAKAALFGLQIELTAVDETFMVGAYSVALFLVIPACWLISPRRRSFDRFEYALGFYLAAEVVLVLTLSRASAGAWINYGIQAVVFASIIVARALARTCAAAPRSGASALIALAALTLMIGVCTDARRSANLRNAERFGTAAVIRHYGRPASEFFFVDRPGINRVNGCLNLVFDDWLYPVFEAVHLAQPRSIWLRKALTLGDIRFVVNKTDRITIDGLGPTLPELGYIRGIMLGKSYYVWQRTSFSTVPRRQ